VPCGTNSYASSMSTSILTESLVAQKHPVPAELRRFLRGEASRAEARALVRHLLAGCAECVAVTRPLWQIAEHGPEVGPGFKTEGNARPEQESAK
jgi:hypothetical protein